MSLPQVPASFSWSMEAWGAALRCAPLTQVARHLFSTRQLRLSSQADWAEVARAVGVDTIVSLEQVHGREVVVLKRGDPLPAGRPAADALVSDRDDVAVAVRAADCVPLLIGDPRTGAVAAVHAGWRGTAASVTTAAVGALTKHFGAHPEDLVVAIGPSIGACCYEVGSELVDAFAAAGHPRHLVDRWFSAPPPARGSHARSALRLDVAGANRDQLILAGVGAERIHVAGLCTAMHLEVLTSFRAERERAGRLAAVITSRR
jgi:YfiH family protein